MKKLVFASAMALAGMSLVSAPALRAQAQANSGQISLPPEQFNDYQSAVTQTDPTAKAAALEGFLQKYPQTPVKTGVLDQLMDTYQQSNQADKALGAASRLLQVEPNNLKAITLSVYIKKQQCQKNVDPQTGKLSDSSPCDDAAALAQKGLGAAKPEGTQEPDWKKMTDQVYPIFDSAIGLDDVLAKSDYAAAVDVYTKELMLYPPDGTKSGQALVDTLSLAEVLTKPSDKKDLVKAIWLYARAYDFAPPQYKTQIEPKLDYWYKRYHGTLDGDAAIKQQIDAIKTQAQATLFPPSSFSIAPAPTPADLAHHAYTSGDPKSLSLEDKEYILANGSDADANGLWALLKGQQTPVPGVLINGQATALKVSVAATAAAKPKDYVVKLNTPADCSAVPPPPTSTTGAAAAAYLQANGASADVSAIEDLDKAHKVTIEPAVGTINVAVTQDAKDSKTADFIVNLKEPASCKEIPAAGATLGLQPATELDATYSTFTKVPAANGKDASAQIMLTDGFVQPEKKAAPVHHKPAAGHHPGR